ncbi:MAG TPA: glutathione-disulfide reductase [Stellaceae bacterium]|jgi:glutathione reductase (NADPH)|nr:glutathione-disulfide reductase [Stellaceae bacterium]
MARYDFDMITLGAGSGGVASSRRAGSYGAKVAIIEESRIGGTCVLRGCVPKKLLVYGAQFADAFADAAGFGWSVAPPSFDWPSLIAAKNKELDRLEQIYKNMLKGSSVEIIEGRGVLVDPHTIEVAGRHYTAENILIATGGHPTVPDIPGIEHVISSNEALDLPALPRKIVIVGGGYIAVEFAGIFRGFGAEVVEIIRREELLYGFDDDLRVALAQEMRGRGIEIHTRCNVTRIEKAPHEGYSVFTSIGQEISADLVMYATGRGPNTRGLGLDAVGVKANEKGAVEVDEWQRTSVPNIYAVGDVTDRLNLTPVAIAEGRALAETLYNANPIRMDHNDVPTAVFSNPPIGTVGLTEEAARAQYGDDVDVYCARFRPMKNTLSGRDERTFMKLVVDGRSERVLGCHMLGPDAPEIIQGLAIAVKCGASKRMFDQTVGIHPSAAEEFVTMREKVVRTPRKEAAE